MTQTGNTAIVLDVEQIVKILLNFLQLFICETLSKRIICLILIAVDLPNGRIAKLLGISERSVRSYKKAVESGNILKLLSVACGGKKSRLQDIETEILEEINQNNYHSKQQIVDMIYEKFGIKTSISAVGRLLKKNGIKRLKCGSLPAKADPAKQRTFFETVLQPLMEKARAGEIDLFFVDAAHFVMGCNFLGYIYGAIRRFVKTFSGRKRYNVLGAMNYLSKRITKVTNTTYINAIEFCNLLRKISSEYVGKTVYIVLDNARYQKCAIVQELAQELGIMLVYLPPYSPNLNLIERFWKHVKSKLRTKYYDDFLVFIETIDSIVNSADKEEKVAIDKLIGSKIQLFDDLVAINENTYVSEKPRMKKAA